MRDVRVGLHVNPPHRTTRSSPLSLIHITTCDARRLLMPLDSIKRSHVTATQPMTLARTCYGCEIINTRRSAVEFSNEIVACTWSRQVKERAHESADSVFGWAGIDVGVANRRTGNCFSTGISPDSTILPT